MTYYKFYHYDPSMAATCLIAVLFGLTMAVHMFQILKYRTWYFIPVVIGGIFEVVGYIARAVSHSEAPHLSLGPYIIQTLLLLVAPPLFAASIYMILARIIHSVDGERCSLISRRWLTRTFVTSDVVCFIVQLGGAGLMASSHASQSKKGSDIVLAGLWAQIVIFGFFMVVAWVFHRRIRAAPTPSSQDGSNPWKIFMRMLYFTCALILVRNIVRVAEFIEGFEGYIIKHEAFLYVFDAFLMLAVMVSFNIWYPFHYSKRATREKEHNLELSTVV